MNGEIDFELHERAFKAGWNAALAEVAAKMPSAQIDDDVGKVWNRCLASTRAVIDRLRASPGEAAKDPHDERT